MQSSLFVGDSAVEPLHGASEPKSVLDVYGVLEDESFVAPEELSFDLDAPRCRFDD